MKSQIAQLPNGMKVHSQRREEALLMYNEVSNYLQHGLTLSKQSIVFDVGANIGMFSLWAYQQCAGDLTVYAFEPIPAIFEFLEANFASIDPNQLHAFRFGLSDSAKVVRFAYYPNATFASTAYPDSAKSDHQLTKTLLARSLHQLPSPLSAIRYLPSVIQKPMIEVISRYINQRQFVTCELQTISEVIHQYGIQRIDILKIDAEKSELDVLNGIEEHDWGKIKQIFAEVHNREGRVNTITELLARQNFSTIISEQDPFFVGTDIYAIYAKR